MIQSAAELVASKRHVLLDFDGPVCAAFAAYGAANISRQLAMLISQGGGDVPAELVSSSDPFELLHYAATLGDPDLLAEVDSEFRRLEVLAIRIAAPTPNAAEVVRALVQLGHTVTIVSNNSTGAIASYAQAHQLAGLLASISARTDPDPSLLKPNPHLLLEALAQLGAAPHDAVMVGDSGTDVEAAHDAEVIAIALANRPDKAQVLRESRPAAVIDRMSALLPS